MHFIGRCFSGSRACFRSNRPVFRSFLRLESGARSAGLYPFRDLAVCLIFASFLLLPGRLLGQNSSRTDVCVSGAAFKKINGLLESKAYRQAKALIDEVSSCRNLTATGRFRLGWAYAQSGDFNAALREFHSVGDNVPTAAVHAYAVALVELELGHYDVAIKTLRALEGHSVLDEASANLLGVAEAKAGNYQDAYNVFRSEIRRHPKDLTAYLNVITLLSDAGEFSEAANIIRGALRVFPDNSQLVIAAGAMDQLLGKDKDALARFAAVVRMEPHNADARFLLAATNYRMGQFGAAKEEVEKGIRDGVVSSDLYYLLAQSELKMNSTSSSDALAAVNRAVQLNSKSVQALALRGRLLLDANRPKAALRDLAAAHHLDPSSHDATYNLARCYSALGKREEAARLYRNLSPHSEDSVTQLSKKKAKKALSEAGSR